MHRRRGDGRLPARIALKPDYADAYNNLGNVCRDQGRLDEALARSRRRVRAQARRPAGGEQPPLQPAFPPRSRCPGPPGRASPLGQQFAAPLAAEIRPHAQRPHARPQSCRVGYVSPDFRAHAVGRLLLPLFAHHDRRQSEIFAYADVRDTRSRHRRARGPRRPLARYRRPERSENWPTRIRADRIDILVDLALHTAGNRLLVFARKPAPVQVTMLGLPATTGLDTIDYRLTDPYLDPPGRDRRRLHRAIDPAAALLLDAISRPRIRRRSASCPPRRTASSRSAASTSSPRSPGRPCSSGSRSSRRVPGSRLVIQAPPGSHLRRRARPVPAGRHRRRAPRVRRQGPRRAYFERFQNWTWASTRSPTMAIPARSMRSGWAFRSITLAGRTAVGRGGVSILSNLGLTELIARTPEEYVAIAVAWARDLARLAALRRGLRQRMQASPLMDGQAVRGGRGSRVSGDVEDVVPAMTPITTAADDKIVGPTHSSRDNTGTGRVSPPGERGMPGPPHSGPRAALGV